MENSNPYETPHTEIIDPSTEGKRYPGINRLQYIILAFVLVVFIVFLGTGSFLAESAALRKIAAFWFPIAFLIAHTVLAALRFRNQGSSGMMALLTIIPLVNVLAAWRLVACQEGFKDADKLDSAGRALTVIYLILVAFVLLSSISPASFSIPER